MDLLDELVQNDLDDNESAKKCYLFVFGKAKSGKSRLISSFMSAEEREAQPPAKSTFMFEFTRFNYNSNTEVNVVFSSDVSESNQVIYDLIEANLDKCCIVWVHDINDPDTGYVANNLSLISDNMQKLKKVTEGNWQRELIEYYQTISSSEPMVPPFAPSYYTFVPLIIVGSFDDKLSGDSDDVFHSYVYHLREVALQFCAGVSVSGSKNLLPMLMACATRQQLPVELWNSINLRNDFFIPPAWDSKEKLMMFEPATFDEPPKLPTSNSEEKYTSLQDFLEKHKQT